MKSKDMKHVILISSFSGTLSGATSMYIAWVHNVQAWNGFTEF